MINSTEEGSVTASTLFLKKRRGSGVLLLTTFMLTLEQFGDRQRFVMASEGEKSLVAELWLPENLVAYIVYDKRGARFQGGRLQEAIDVYNKCEG